jgi:hypothetical protein
MTIKLPTNQKALMTFVDRRHPDYNRRKKHWNFCDQTYEGGRDWFEENIHPYLKEGTLEYASRLKRAFRFNHTKEVIQLVTKYIFKSGVTRNTEDSSKALQKFWANACIDGSSIDVLMKRISDWSSVNGRVWVVIDSKVPDGIVSIADEKNAVTKIYAYLVKQRDVLDFSYDEWGKLNWILYRIAHRDDEDPIASSGIVVPRYMLWTRDEWIVLEDQEKEKNTGATLVVSQSNSAHTEGVITGSIDTNYGRNRKIVLIARGPNALGEIPVFPADHLENEETYGPPGLIDDIAYLDRAVSNYLSNLDAIIQDQTFSQLAMPSQAMLPGEEAYNKMLEMGTKRIFLYDGESQHGPEFLVPDASQGALIVSVIKMIIGEIYHSIGMAGERTKQDNAMGIDNSSGVAKAYDFDRMNALLSAKADMLQRTEERMSYLVRRWADEIPEAPINIPAEDATVDSFIYYPDTYDIRGLPDEFEIADSLALLEAPDSVRRQQMQVIINKLFPRLAKDLIAQVDKDLQDWPVDPNEQMQGSLDVVSKLGDVVAKVQTQIGAPPGATPSKPAGAKPASKSKQGQNPGKSKSLSK